MMPLSSIALMIALAVPGAAQDQQNGAGLPEVEVSAVLVKAKEFTVDAAPAGTPANRILTVRADLAMPIGTWTGIRSCADPTRAQEAIQAALDRWIGQQKLAHSDKKLLGYGQLDSSVRVENRTRNGRRSCKGSFTAAPVYARFY